MSRGPSDERTPLLSSAGSEVPEPETPEAISNGASQDLNEPVKPTVSVVAVVSQKLKYSNFYVSHLPPFRWDR